ncbi:heavy metal translocating P-type ATPase [Vagococcus penaei]|nr:heavy metal translocating P-type ATPase [Vagococcus penaei]RSU06787.1 heavy metal translocating P-type ATPase [Vagococcus penaei]
MSCKQAHTHNDNHHDEHNHGQLPTILYFIGLLTFVIAFMIPSTFIRNSLFMMTLILSGYHIIIEGFVDTYNQTKQHKKFTPNVHVLMALAAIGASIIGDFREAALLILIFAGAHFLEHFVEDKSKREITSLLKLNPTDARLIQLDGSTKLVPVESLKIGDTLKVLHGDQVPTDGTITYGTTTINESSINGESMPADKTVGDPVFGSTINGNGTFTMTVTKASSDTVFAKIIALVNQSQDNLSKTATRIKRFEPKYVTAVLIIIPLYIVLATILLDYSWYESFYKGMVFLTVASPCALAASDIPATLSAISNLAKRGVLFKGGAFLSNLSQIKAIAFDKTGTLTMGIPKVTDTYIISEMKNEMDTILNVVVAMEKQSNHPLANAILDYFTPTQMLEIEVDNQIGHGLITTYHNETYEIGKPTQFNEVPRSLLEKHEIYANEGKTVVFVAKNQQAIGLIAMMDVPNEQAKDVINYLKDSGIHTAMITGDSEKTGVSIAKEVGVDEVFGNVLPEDKAAIIHQLQATYGDTAMVGDGINDAPALVTSDIGIAMGNGTDVAIDVADVVLMKNDLLKLKYAYQISQKLDKIVRQNIIFAMCVVLTLIIINLLGNITLPIGIIVHEGSTLVVLFNGLRLLNPLKKD